MLPDKDVRITIRSAENSQEFVVTATHWPMKISIEAAFSDQRNETSVINQVLYELERRVAMLRHRKRKNRPWS